MRQNGLLPFFSLAGLIIGSAVGQVRINEIMASNTRTYAEITDFEDYPDWLELHNPGVTEAPLDGFFLSDNPTRPFKWKIPESATIPPGGYLLIMADGYNADVGETHQRDYWPFEDFDTEKYHSNFSLSSAGESVVLTSTSGLTNEGLIALGSTWKYLDDGSAQTTQWRGRLYDDGTWQSGAAPLGYGDEEFTEISYGGDDDNRFITSYFRHSFDVVDPASLASLVLTLQVDDSAVIYLNGNEIIRRNLPSGELIVTTQALVPTGPPEEADFNSYNLTTDFLIPGTNVLAVEVHQISRTSSDMRLDLSLSGTSYTGVTSVDSITYSQQITDVPLARSPSDSSVWVSLDRGTPGEENAGNEVINLRSTSGNVEITPEGGPYAASQNITLSAAAGEIRYTLDGTEPESDDLLYDGPFEVAEPAAIRARVFESGKAPGQIVTQTYLIGEEFNGLPILSITAEPETLFGDEIGIYLNKHEPDRGVGPAIYKGKDAPGHLEFFPHDGSEGFAVNGGLRMGGENNWSTHLQRAFNFATRGKYGDDELKYDLFPGSKVPIFTALTIREGGDDYANARLSDAIFDEITQGRMEVESNQLRAATVFINGEYWGHYNIRDRWDDNWFFQHYGVNSGEYDHIRFQGTSRGTPPRIENGSNQEWNELFAFIRGNDLTNPAVWAFVKSRIDLESFIDFVIAESWGNNSSWTGNREAWKAHAPGSKWRWFIPDMDRTFRNADGNTLSDMLSRDQILRYLKDNSEFRGMLAQRFAAHIASTLEPDRVNRIVDQLGAAAAPEIQRTSERWGGAPSLEEYEDSLQDMKDYVDDRADNMLAQVEDELDLDPLVDLTLATTGEGTFLIQGVEVSSRTLPVFSNIPTPILALPAPGYRFEGWIGIDDEESTVINLMSDSLVIAQFVPSDAPDLGGQLTEDTTLSSLTPYAVGEDLIIPNGITLTINSGVTLEMASGRNIRVVGTLIINGSETEKVTIRGRNGRSWGGISFEQPSTLSSLSRLVIRGASRGNDPIIYPSAISGLDADLDLEFLDIGESRGPLFFRGGSMSLRDSILDIPLTGDGLNVKQGAAETLRCTFTGHNSPDTDAIDYDGVVNGVIKDCRIYRFLGFNSDGIDTGEQCVNVLIEGNTIFYSSDKGISVGQGSSVILRKNLIVGCAQGVGVKDANSTILIDQNTFVDCAEGVAVFEKNFGSGGGVANVTNCIFSQCHEPVTVDSLSTLTVSYSMSDTLALVGAVNQENSPLFVDAAGLNFELTLSSPAINSGDPAHESDPDGTRADIGARYQYSFGDYPFSNTNTVVINEVLSNSGNAADWIELYNRTDAEIAIGGWFLSDDASNLLKYRIPTGTTIPAKGYLIFYEDTNFGVGSLDPNRLTGFALSDTGETVYLSSATNGQLDGYLFDEDFGPSFEGDSIGYYLKPSTGTYNFVTQTSPTQAGQNLGPKIGPVVISEIMYNPADDGDSEYLELLNVSDAPVTLFDSSRNRAWRLSNGIEFEFPATSPVTLTPGQRLILTRNLGAFENSFAPPEGPLVLEWQTGKLSNGGETVQLERPGPLDDLGGVSYVRVDRVKYDNSSPWDFGADGSGLALTKIIENEYGNDSANWIATTPTPGDFAAGDRYALWATNAGVGNPNADPDGDGFSNLFEYAVNTDPNSLTTINPISTSISGGVATIAYGQSILKPDLNINIEFSRNLNQWSFAPTQANGNLREARMARELKAFFRLRISQKR
jgi:hypothetical protein